MRLAHVTNYHPTRSGHVLYTENLIRGIQTHRPDKQFVIGERGSAPHDDERVGCLPAWRRGEDYVVGIVRALREVRAEVAILQYSNDLFGEDERFPRLVREIEASGTRAVVTLHSVYDVGRRIPFGRVGDFDRAIGERASRLHVHSARMRADVLARGVAPEKVVVIPHGSKAMAALDPAESRARLGIPRDARVVLFFGFIWLGKGVDPLLGVFRRLLRRVPDAFLYIGGYTRLKIWGGYVTYLRAKARLLGIAGRAHLYGDYVPDDLVPVVYSAADVVAMPYRQDYSSVSGVVHQTAGMGKLMLCSNISKFDEVGESIAPDLLVEPDDSEGWVRGLERLLCDAPFAEEMRRRILAFGEATSWPEVARRHIAVHDELSGREVALAC